MAQRKLPLWPPPAGVPHVGSLWGKARGARLGLLLARSQVAAVARRGSLSPGCCFCAHKSATVLTACLPMFPGLWSVRVGAILCVLWCAHP